MPFIIPLVAGVVGWAITTDGLVAGGILGFIGISSGTLGATIIGSLAAAGIMALGQAVLTPAQKRTFTVRDPIATHKVIIGQLKCGGALTFVDTTLDNQTIFLVVTLAGHPVESIDGFYLNDTYVPLDPSTGQAKEPAIWPDGTKPTNYTNHCQVFKGLGTVTGDAALISALQTATTKWGSNFFQNSRAKVYVRLGWDQNLFGSTGIPNIACVVRGRMVYDPRNTGVVITNSASGSPGVFNTATNHNLVTGQMVFIRNHTGATPVSQPTWPQAQRNNVAQEYEVASTPSATSFTVYGIDSNPLATTTNGNGGTVTPMTWTDNSALCLSDYLVEPVHGMAALYDTEVDANNVITAANICDEQVPRILPTSTFTADPTLNQITWQENAAAGALPPLCEVVLTTTGSLPGGLSGSTVYYYAQVGAGPVGVLCTSAANAAHNPPINVDITSAGTGVQTLEIVESLSPDTSTQLLNVYQNSLRITTGTEVILGNFGGAPPSGLATGVSYWAIFIADNVIQVAASLSDARNNIPISFSTAGTGVTFVTVENESRYTCNGLADTSSARQDIIQKILSSMGGYLVPSGTFLNIFAAAYITPTVTLDETDFRGPLALTALQSGMSSFNSVKGTFIDPFNRGQPTDYPQLQNTTYIQDDNYEVVWSDLTLEFTNSSSMAQRLAKIYMERVRRELTVNMPLKLTAFQVGSPDTININNTQLGWVLETFEASSWRFSINAARGGGSTLDVDIIARQTDSAVYAWTAAEEAAAKRQSNTNLPNPFVVSPPSSLTLQSGGALLVQQTDGTIVSRIEVSWTSPVDEFVLNGGLIEVVYKPHSASTWQSAATVPGDNTIAWIENAAIGTSYDIAARARNAIGAVSDTTHPWQAEIDNYTVLGKTNAPSDISSITVVLNGLTVTLAGSPITDTDVVSYEYRYGVGTAWAGMTLIEQAAAVPNGSGGYAGVCTTGSIPTGTWHFAVKAINRSGIYSVNAAVSSAIGVTNTVPSGAIPAGYITALMFASSIQPVGIVSGSPPGGSGSYVGQVVVSTTDSRLYRWNGSAWTLEVPAADVSGQIVTTQIANNSISTPKLQANSVDATILAANSVYAAAVQANAITAGTIAVGAVNATAIVVDDILVTGHLVDNAVTAPNYASAGAQTMNNSGLSSLVSLTYTTNPDGVGQVEIEVSDYFNRSGGHSPTGNYQIFVDGVSVYTYLSGGAGVTFYQPVSFLLLVTGLSAGASHTFDLQASVFGGDPSCTSEAAQIRVTELAK